MGSNVVIAFTLSLSAFAAVAATDGAGRRAIAEAEADREFAALGEGVRKELVEAEGYRRERLAEVAKRMGALREELAMYRPGSPPPRGGRGRAEVVRELDECREAHATLADNEAFCAREFVAPLRAGQVVRLLGKCRVVRVLGPRASVVEVRDAKGAVERVVLAGEPTADLAAGQAFSLDGVFRIGEARTPKGEAIPQATRAKDLEAFGPRMLDAVKRFVDRGAEK